MNKPEITPEERQRRLAKAILNGFGAGGKPRKYYFTYLDIATVCGVQVQTVANAKFRGEIDPKNFESVVKWCSARLNKRSLSRGS
jgi:hypothetical protein